MKKSIGLILLVGLGLAACQAPKPVSLNPAPYMTAGNMFLKGIMQGQIQGTYAQWVSPGAKNSPRFSLAQFTADWQAIIEKYGPIQSARLNYYQIVPGRKIVQLYYSALQGKGGPVEYHLVTESDARGRCTVFLIDIGNAQVFPQGGNPGKKVALPQPLEVTP